jgi:heme-degrading monooxygenase HmoA
VSGTVRVLIQLRAPGGEAGGILDAYHAISRELDGTPGLRGNQLLRETSGGDGFVVLSEWTDLDAFRGWEQSSTHRNTTAPLRPYQDRRGGRSFGIYEVVAAYGAPA